MQKILKGIVRKTSVRLFLFLMTFKPFFCYRERKFFLHMVYILSCFSADMRKKRKSLYAGQTLLLKVFMNQMAEKIFFPCNKKRV